MFMNKQKQLCPAATQRRSRVFKITPVIVRGRVHSAHVRLERSLTQVTLNKWMAVDRLKREFELAVEFNNNAEAVRRYGMRNVEFWTQEKSRLWNSLRGCINWHYMNACPEKTVSMDRWLKIVKEEFMDKDRL